LDIFRERVFTRAFQLVQKRRELMKWDFYQLFMFITFSFFLCHHCGGSCRFWSDLMDFPIYVIALLAKRTLPVIPVDISTLVISLRAPLFSWSLLFLLWSLASVNSGEYRSIIVSINPAIDRFNYWIAMSADMVQYLNRHREESCDFQTETEPLGRWEVVRAVNPSWRSIKSELFWIIIWPFHFMRLVTSAYRTDHNRSSISFSFWNNFWWEFLP
jgi:hypothetical protein